MASMRAGAKFITGCAFALSVSACDGGSSSAPAPAPVTTVQVFSGTTRQIGSGCTGDSHDIQAQSGAIAVRLLETSDAAGALSVQVCAAGIDNGNCSIKQQKIMLGQTIAGSRMGTSTQNLKLLGHNCVFGGPAVADPISYRAEITYQK